METGQVIEGVTVRNKILNRLKTIITAREFGVLVALLIMAIILSIVTPAFATPRNLLNIGRQVSIVGIIAVGMTFILVAGDIDISVGSTYALAAIIAGMLMRTGVNVWLSSIAGLLVGVGVGAFNGFFVTKGKLPAFIATLGSMSIVRGLALVITAAYPVVISGNVLSGPSGDLFFFLGGGRLFGVIPMQFVFYLGILVIGGILLAKTTFGFRVYATGGNARAAYLSGVNVQRVRFMNYLLLGLLVGVAGLLSLSFMGTVTATVGEGYEMDVIAAVIIGGAPLGGGGGTIVGTLIGTVIMGVLRNGLVLLGVSPFWQTVAIGAVIILAVGLDKWVIGRKKA
jgi:ribose/xylose/arabinose/galactoside ABC-type transport system permease subunit